MRCCLPLLILLLVLLAGNALAQEYVIGPRDILTVNVWGEKDLSQDYTVSVSGTILMPLIGEVRAAGLTERQLGEELRNRLQDGYLVNPQVVVSVKEYRSQKVLVLGDAAKPGLYPLTGTTTLLEVLTQAGGLSGSGSREILLVRPVRLAAKDGSVIQGSNTIRRIDVDKIQLDNPADNVLLEDGDTVIIPRANSAFVLGEVKNPGDRPLGRDTTILEVITLAGGFTDKAAANAVKVIRKTGGREEILSVDLSGQIPRDRNFVLQNSDAVIVPRGNSFFIFGEVKSPGTFVLDKGWTILEAITAAGGFTGKAAPGRTKIIRSTPKGQETIYVDMNEIINKGRRDKSVPLMENDVIVVPESFF
jgi:polysaccharide export outer membrane protein